MQVNSNQTQNDKSDFIWTNEEVLKGSADISVDVFDSVKGE